MEDLSYDKTSGIFYLLISDYEHDQCRWGGRSATHSASSASDRRRQTPDAGSSEEINISRFQPGSIAASGIVESAAAYGINRPEIGKRTVPSALNWQEIDLYVSMAGGLYLYDAKTNRLKPILNEDIRPLTGKQPFVKTAPVNLIMVADFSRMGKSASEEKEAYAHADAAFIGQNVYLFCASEGLATVFRASIDKPALAKAMKLREDQKILFSQTVGYGKK